MIDKLNFINGSHLNYSSNVKSNNSRKEFTKEDNETLKESISNLNLNLEANEEPKREEVITYGKDGKSDQTSHNTGNWTDIFYA